MNFTQDWIKDKGLEQHWIKYLSEFKDKKCSMLEIGSFEGMSAIWFLENILTNENSHIDCVDTFEGDQQQNDMGVDTSDVEKRFVENVRDYADKNKLSYFKGRSDEFLKFKGLTWKYDIIYIDGSHLQIDVLKDAVLSWDLLKKGGVMIFDDYGMDFTDKDRVFYCPKTAIDAFLQVYDPQLEIIFHQWQMIIRKK